MSDKNVARIKKESNSFMFLEALPYIALLVNKRGSIEFYNKKWLENTNFSPKIFSLTDLKKIIHSDDYKNAAKFFKTAIKTNRVNEIELRLRNDKKDYKWFLVSVSHIEEINKVLITAIYIDSSKQELKKSQQTSMQHFLMYEKSPFSTLIFDKEGKIIALNKAFVDLWKVKLEDLKQYNILKDKRPRFKEISPYIEKVYKGESVKIPAVRYSPNKNLVEKGSVRYLWVDIWAFPIKDNDGNIQNVILMHEDITARKSLEEDLIKANAILNTIIQKSPLPIYVFNSKTLEVKLWNWAAEKLFGWSEKEVLGKVLPTIPSEDKDRSFKVLDKVLKENFATIEARRMKKDGTIFDVFLSASLIFDPESESPDVITIAKDITETKSNERRKDEFISIMSHELRSPITNLKILSGILKKQTISKKKESGDVVNKLDRQINYVAILVDKILDIIRLQSDKLRLSKKKFNISELINEIVENNIHITGANIIIKRNPKIIIVADKSRITQVLTNLLSNATKYSPKNMPIYVSLLNKKDYIKVHIKDSGIGISKKYHASIFEKFFQISSSDNMKEDQYSGLGIGLYIAKEIINMHKGEIWVESSKGKGADFIFTLPIK